MGIPNVKLGKFKVAIIGLLMTPPGGKRKGIVWNSEVLEYSTHSLPT